MRERGAAVAADLDIFGIGEAELAQLVVCNLVNAFLGYLYACPVSLAQRRPGGLVAQGERIEGPGFRSQDNAGAQYGSSDE